MDVTNRSMLDYTVQKLPKLQREFLKMWYNTISSTIIDHALLLHR